jgi:hypothetical protein
MAVQTLDRGTVPVDVRIGVTDTPKELEVELGDHADPDELAQLEASLASGTGVVWLTDRRGRRFGIPAAKIAWIELGTASDERQVGFGSHVR